MRVRAQHAVGGEQKKSVNGLVFVFYYYLFTTFKVFNIFKMTNALDFICLKLKLNENIE